MAQTLRNEMAALRNVFPSWDAEVLRDLLEEQQGDLERIVDSLLATDAAPSVPQMQNLQLPPSLLQAPHFLIRDCASIPDNFLHLPSEEH
ncbi:uncharacterized protein CCR75_008846 [Bremia lactucae]|uniref:CUE domain-containing protein n=1 Tax=Bremia lactucae TaxID=4779 RepID=A0A976NZV9_BRELC|nr:hypothetical protein CCR75_008846 [Bremia lactucae]